MDEFNKTIEDLGLEGVTFTKNKKGWTASVRTKDDLIGSADGKDPATAIINAAQDAAQEA